MDEEKRIQQNLSQQIWRFICTKLCEKKKKDHVIDKEDENDNPFYYLFISPLCNQNVLFRCNLWSSLLISENISYHWFPKE